MENIKQVKIILYKSVTGAFSELFLKNLIYLPLTQHCWQ